MSASSPMTKCLLITPHYFPMYGGALTVYDNYSRNAGGQIEILTAYTNYIDGQEVNGWQAFDAGASYPVHRIEALRSSRDRVPPSFPVRIWKDWCLDRKVWKAVRSLLKERKANIVCIGALDTLGWLVRPIKKLLGLKVVVFVHGEEVAQEAYSWLADRRRHKALHGADKIIVVSSFTAKVVQEKYEVPAGRVCCLPNGVDLEQFDCGLLDERANAPEALEKPYTFSCGRLVARKGFDILIEAWKRVTETLPHAQLVIGGEGPLESKLKARIKELHLEDNIRMLGWVPNEALPIAYGNADLFVMPNRTMDDGDTEGFGLVLLEAAAMGVPSIAGVDGGVPDAVMDGETGILVDSKGADEVAARIIELLTDDALRKRLGNNALKHAQTQGWSEKTEELLSILTKTRNDG